jgi:hypothetical protein
MSYYTALINAWNTGTVPSGYVGTALTGLTTANKLIAINGWTITGVVPTSIQFTGNQLANCIDKTEFNALSWNNQQNILGLCQITGNLAGGSANTELLPVGMILTYFTASATITSGTYNNATGVVTLTMSGSIGFGVGGNVTVAGLTGTGAFASLDGIFAAISPTSGTTVTYNAGAGLGASTITGGYLVPPTITNLTALAQGTVTPWWQNNGYSSPFTMNDLAAAGGLT